MTPNSPGTLLQSACTNALEANKKSCRLLRIPTVLDRLACGRTTFYGYVNGGLIPLVKLGASSRVPEDALDRFIANLPALKPKAA